MALAREERRFGGVSPGVAFALATAGERVGDERRRRGLRRTYALGAVGPGAVDGRGGVDHVEDGPAGVCASRRRSSGRRSRRPTGTPSEEKKARKVP